MRRLPIVIVATVFAGCAASTGILPAGPDTYAVTAKFAPIRGGSLAAQPEALAEAQTFCQNQGRVFLAVQMGETAPRAEFGSTGYQIVFKCLAAGDPTLQAH
jgi:hypothetical protein